MPRDITVHFEDGSQHVYRGAPDDVTPDQVQVRATREFGKQVVHLDGGRPPAAAAAGPLPAAPAARGGFLQHAGNLGAGLVRGAGSIGATVLDAARGLASGAVEAMPAEARPQLAADIATLPRGDQARTGQDDALRTLGAQPDSAIYGAGKLAGEIAGTWPVGGMAGKALEAAGAARLGTAVGSAGFRTGAPAATTLAGRAADLGIRAAGGAASGALTAGAVDPTHLASGALVGAVAPNVIRGLGAAGTAVGKTASAAGRGVRALAEPFTEGGRRAIASRVLVNAAGDDAPAVAARLAQARELVPGSVPTAGQVALNGGVAALDRAMEAAQPAAFTERALEQSAARLEALRGVAGDVGQREFFAGARQHAADELYSRAFREPIVLEKLTLPQRGEIRALMSMPAIQAAVKEARQNALNNGMRLDNVGSVFGLHQAKLAMDDAISKLTGTGAAQENKARAIGSARDRLVSFIEDVSPAYAEARATYRAMSEPINQLDVGQAMLDKLQPALADHGALARQNAAAYAHSLRNADQVTRTATGRNMRFEQVMTPEQRQVMENIAADLARKANREDLGRGVGSNTFQNLVMGNLASSTGLPHKVASALPAMAGSTAGAALGGSIAGVPGGVAGAGLGKALSALYGSAEGKVQQEIGQSLLNPQTAAQMMTQELQRRALAANRTPMLSPEARRGLDVLFARPSPLVLTGQ